MTRCASVLVCECVLVRACAHVRGECVHVCVQGRWVQPPGQTLERSGDGAIVGAARVRQADPWRGPCSFKQGLPQSTPGLLGPSGW